MFLPLDHLTVEHEYSSGNWQDFTADLTTVSLVLREWTGQHTAALSFYNAAMDPAQSSGTHVVKKGDTVRVHMNNAAGVSRKVATFLVRKVETAIDLKKPPGRRYLVTITLRGKGFSGVAGAGSSKGVDTIDDLSDVITGAPFEIGGDGFGSGRTTPIGTSTEVAYTEVASQADQISITRDSNPGVIVFEDPDGRIQVFDSATQRTGASAHTIDAGDYSAIDLAFDIDKVINVLTLKYLEKIKTAGKPTRTVELDATFEDAPSIAKYGRCKKTHKIHKKTNFSAYAADVFARNADPEPVPRSVVIPVRKPSELRPGYQDGHYVGSKVDVVHPDGVTTYTCRVAKIQHTITNRRWLVQVFLRHPDVVTHRRHTLSTEVAHNPDGTILNAHVDDDAVDARTIAPSSVGISEAAGDLIGIIDDAQNAADFAQATADGKAKVTYSTSDPSGTPAVGDTWYKFSGAVVVGQWKGTAGSPNTWVAVTLDSTTIANLDAGKITTGILSGITIRGALFETRAATAGRARLTILSETSTGDVDRITFETGRSDEVSVGRLDVVPGTVGGLAPSLLLTAPSIRTDSSSDPYLSLSPAATGDGTVGSGNGTAKLNARYIELYATTELRLYAPAIRIGGLVGAPSLHGLDWAKATITTNASGLATVNHNLGRTPQAVFVISKAGSAVHNRTYRIDSVTASVFVVEVWNTATNAADASATRDVMWLAIA